MKPVKIKTDVLIKASFLAAISYILYLFEFQIPIFPTFLKFDLSEVPVIIGALLLGPIPGIIIAFVKNALNLFHTTSAGVGQLANFLIGGTYVLTLCFVMGKHRSAKRFALGATAAVISMSIVACVLNYFLLVPFYSMLFGIPIDAFVDMANNVNRFATINDFMTLIVFAFLPFNIIKGIMLSVCSFPLYKALAFMNKNNRHERNESTK